MLFSYEQRALDLGITQVRVKVKGLGPGRKVSICTQIQKIRKCCLTSQHRSSFICFGILCFQSSVKGLELGGLNVFSITDVTPVPHNGCRPRKVRRL